MKRFLILFSFALASCEVKTSEDKVKKVLLKDEIKCVVLVENGIKLYSSDRKDFLKERELDHEFEDLMFRLSNYEVPVIDRKVMKDIDPDGEKLDFGFFSQVTSYSNCDVTAEYVKKSFHDIYNFYPDIQVVREGGAP